MKAIPVKVIVAVLMLGVSSVCTAEACVDRTGQALAELRGVFPEMDEAQAADAERILVGLCDASAPSTPGTEAATTQPESDSPSVLGVEFNKAEPDSKGHSRLRKTH